MIGFSQILDSAEKLSLDEQESLLETLRRRVAEQRREEIVAAVREARREFAAGKCKPASPAAIMKRIAL